MTRAEKFSRRRKRAVADPSEQLEFHSRGGLGVKIGWYHLLHGLFINATRWLQERPSLCNLVDMPSTL